MQFTPCPPACLCFPGPNHPSAPAPAEPRELQSGICQAQTNREAKEQARVGWRVREVLAPREG